MVPVVLIGGFGFIFQRTIRPSIAGINQLVFYVGAPALTFSSLSRTQISGNEVSQIAVYSLLYIVAMIVFSLGISTVLRWERDVSRAFIVTMMQINGNYAFSVALLALGQEGLDRAVIFNVVQGTVGGIIAMFFASNSTEGVKESILAVLRRPTLYATFLAVLMNVFSLHFPVPVQSAVDMLGASNIPLVLVIMGMQMGIGLDLDAPVATGVAVFVRLFGSVALAYVLTGLVGMEGLSRHVMLLYAAMPTAIMATVIATEFNARPRFVAGVVVITTALSVVTVSLWLIVLAIAFT